MTDATNRAKARAALMTLHKGSLGKPEVDFNPVFGPEALSLVSQLTRTSYGLARKPPPTYSRADIPCKFVPWHAR